MKNQTPLTKSRGPLRNSHKRSSRHCGTVAGLLILLVLGCLALSPQVRAVCRDGCNTTNFNTFQGEDALLSNTTGSGNTAIGDEALTSNTAGDANTASGYAALISNTTGSLNTATGVSALESNTTGSNNTASGYDALFSNTTGVQNTATGWGALASNTTANNNTANGMTALENNTTGHDNIAEGFQALQNNTTGSSNIALGSSAGLNLTTGSNNIDIGALGVAGESKKIRIGKLGVQTATFIAGISGAVVPTGVAVIVDTSGHLGTTTSSARFKEAIGPMNKASEAILSLRPVSFRYKKELDPERIPQFGLVAEDVEKVNPELVVRDEAGKPYTVRYDAVNAMLLNEFLKEHRTVEEQKATIAQIKSTVAKRGAGIAQQQKEIQALTANLKEQAAEIQKVSAQVQVSLSASQQMASKQ